MLDANVTAAERKLEGKGGGVKLPVPAMDFEDLSRGE